jgi:hydroxyacid-oxoacid transhydrogenase
MVESPLPTNGYPHIEIIPSKEVRMEYDSAFEVATSHIRFGPGATREVGMDLADLNVKRVMVLTDAVLSMLPPIATVLDSLSRHGIEYSLFANVRVEPTNRSLKEAIESASADVFDGFIAVGGGSTMDTAKVANLYTSYPPDDFLDYVNPPIGKGLPVPGPLKPLFAIPTTAGTGSETTGVAIFDFEEMHAKTGISHRGLRPTLGVVDPDNTRTLPPLIAASTGLDVLTHALESYTATPFNRRTRPERPALRPTYQGSNPVSDIWSIQALRMVEKYLVRAVEDPTDDEARGSMLLAASYAGFGFGNAGCTLPHAMSYPVSGMVRGYRPDGYPVDHPIVPHGMAVVLNAPAAIRFTAPACPERHLQAADALGANTSNATLEDAGAILSHRVIEIMMRLNMPNGLSAIGYSRDDIPRLVQGALPQHRVLKLSPRPVDADDLARVFDDAMTYW